MTSDEIKAEAERRFPLWLPSGDYEIDREDYSELDAKWQNEDAERDRAHFIQGAKWQREQDRAKLDSIRHLHFPVEVEPSDSIRRLDFPVEIEPSYTICGECSMRLPNGKYFGRLEEWPCPTLQVIGETDE